MVWRVRCHRSPSSVRIASRASVSGAKAERPIQKDRAAFRWRDPVDPVAFADQPLRVGISSGPSSSSPACLPRSPSAASITAAAAAVLLFQPLCQCCQGRRRPVRAARTRARRRRSLSISSGRRSAAAPPPATATEPVGAERGLGLVRCDMNPAVARQRAVAPRPGAPGRRPAARSFGPASSISCNRPGPILASHAPCRGLAPARSGRACRPHRRSTVSATPLAFSTSRRTPRHRPRALGPPAIGRARVRARCSQVQASSI